MNVRTKFMRWRRNIWAKFGPRRRVYLIQSDSLPERIPRRGLVLARDEGEDWCVGFRCPCGCGEVIELLAVREAKPRWDITVDGKGWPTLSPSVWRQEGCCSHFWIRSGRIYWCE